MTTLTFNGVKVTLIFSDPDLKMCYAVCDGCGCYSDARCEGPPHAPVNCDTCVQCEKVKDLQREVFQLKRTLEQILSMITRGVEFNLDAPATSTCEERQASIPVIALKNEP